MSVFIVVILAATALAVARSLLALRRSEPGLESAGHVNTILGGTGVGLFFLAIGIRMPSSWGSGSPS